jgi:hypothetical protein
MQGLYDPPSVQESLSLKIEDAGFRAHLGNSKEQLPRRCLSDA